MLYSKARKECLQLTIVNLGLSKVVLILAESAHFVQRWSPVVYHQIARDMKMLRAKKPQNLIAIREKTAREALGYQKILERSITTGLYKIKREIQNASDITSTLPVLETRIILATVTRSHLLQDSVSIFYDVLTS